VKNGRMRVHDGQTETGGLLDSAQGGKRSSWGRVQADDGWDAGENNNGRVEDQ
jgi:hypothetical protein